MQINPINSTEFKGKIKVYNLRKLKNTGNLGKKDFVQIETKTFDTNQIKEIIKLNNLSKYKTQIKTNTGVYEIRTDYDSVIKTYNAIKDIPLAVEFMSK